MFDALEVIPPTKITDAQAERITAIVSVIKAENGVHPFPVERRSMENFIADGIAVVVGKRGHSIATCWFETKRTEGGYISGHVSVHSTSEASAVSRLKEHLAEVGIEAPADIRRREEPQHELDHSRWPVRAKAPVFMAATVPTRREHASARRVSNVPVFANRHAEKPKPEVKSRLGLIIG